jgi:hypothetical protein
VVKHLHSKEKALYQGTKNHLDSPSVIRRWKFQSKGLGALGWRLRIRCSKFSQEPLFCVVLYKLMESYWA